jgi:aminoglycoside 2''-phosphotransferase
MDVSPDHVLIDERTGDISGIIDWGDVAIGDPARDFIFLYEDWGDDFLRLALRAYARETAARLLPRIYLRYLADQLEWTLHACADGRGDDIAHGIVALDDAVADFGRAAAAPLRDDVPPRDTAVAQHTSNGGMQS